MVLHLMQPTQMHLMQLTQTDASHATDTDAPHATNTDASHGLPRSLYLVLCGQYCKVKITAVILT